MAHLSDHAALLGRSAAGPAGLVFRVRFALAPARAPRQLLIGLLFGLLIGYRHEAVVHPDRRPAVVGKSGETRSVFPALQERGEGASYQHSGHHYAQGASRNCPSLPCWGSPFRATIVALAGAQLLPQMSNFLPLRACF